MCRQAPGFSTHLRVHVSDLLSSGKNPAAGWSFLASCVLASLGGMENSTVVPTAPVNRGMKLTEAQLPSPPSGPAHQHMPRRG